MQLNLNEQMTKKGGTGVNEKEDDEKAETNRQTNM